MNRLSHHHTRRNIIIAASACVVLLGIGAFVYFFPAPARNHGDTDTIDYSPATSDQIKAGTETKQKSTSDGKPGASGSETPEPPTQQPGSSKAVAAVHLTSANQNGHLFQLRFQIDANTDNGTCSLTLTKGSQTLTYSADIQPLNQTTTCKGFDVPIDAAHLTPGTWQADLSFTSNTLTGSVSSSIEVK